MAADLVTLNNIKSPKPAVCGHPQFVCGLARTEWPFFRFVAAAAVSLYPFGPFFTKTHFGARKQTKMALKAVTKNVQEFNENFDV